MKFIFALLLLVLGAYLVGFFLPQNYTVSREQTIQASPDEIHALVNDLHTWADWSAFKLPAKEGVTTESEYSGPATGVGAVWRWSGLGDIKPAELEIVTSRPDTGIGYSLSMDGGRVKTQGKVEYLEVDGGVKVTMTNDGEMSTPWSRYFYFLADKSIGPTLEQSLSGLQERLAGGPATNQDQDSESTSNGPESEGDTNAPSDSE